jgi:hypothetical protein
MKRYLLSVARVPAYRVRRSTRHLVDCGRYTNVAQIVISGTRRLRPKGTISIPLSAWLLRRRNRGGCHLCHHTLLASAPSRITNKEVAELSGKTAR